MNERVNSIPNLTLRTISTDTTILTNIDSRSSMNTLSPTDLINEKPQGSVKYSKNAENDSETKDLPKHVEVEFLLEKNSNEDATEDEKILYYEGFPTKTKIVDVEEKESIKSSTTSDNSKKFFQVCIKF